MLSIENIEKEIITNYGSQPSSWFRMGKMLLKVQNYQLYKPQHLSFTQYIQSLSYTLGVSPSQVWRILKATQVYLRYFNEDPPPASITSEKLELFEKITRFSTSQFSENLKQQLLTKTISTATLREIWQSYRPDNKMVSHSTKKLRKVKVIVHKAEIIDALKALKNYDHFFPDHVHLQSFFGLSPIHENSLKPDCIALFSDTQNSKTFISGIKVIENQKSLTDLPDLQPYLNNFHYFLIALPNHQNLIDATIDSIHQSAGIFTIHPNQYSIDDIRKPIQVIRPPKNGNPSPTLLSDIKDILLRKLIKK